MQPQRKGDSMKRKEAILAAVALVSAVIYALACRPAWSPSGKEVVFPYGTKERTGVAVYNRETKTVRTLLEGEQGAYIGAQSAWTSDGKALYVVKPAGDTEVLTVLRVDPATGKSAEVAAIGIVSQQAPSYFPPLLVDDKYMWLGYLVTPTKDSVQTFCAKVNLESGEVQHFFESEKTITILYDFGSGGRWYMKVDEQGESAEIGRFDAAAANLTSAYAVKDGKVAPFIAVEPSGARVAVVVEEGERYTLRLVKLSDGSKRDIKLPEVISEPGGMEWVGETLWLGATVSRSKAAEGAAGEPQTATAEGHDDGGDGTADVALLAVDTVKGEVKVKPLGKGLDSRCDDSAGGVTGREVSGGGDAGCRGREGAGSTHMGLGCA